METKFLALGMVFLTVMAAHAQESQNAPVFTEQVNVNLVNLDVVVEDKNGNQIHGLTAEDFVVTENGAPVTIEGFEEVDFSQRVTLAVNAPEQDPPTVLEGSGPQQFPRTDDHRKPLHVVIYVDDANLHPLNRRKVVPHLQSYLYRLPSHARVMLVRSFRSAEIIQPFNANRASVSASLDQLETKFGGRGQVAGERQEIFNDIYGEKNESLLRGRVFSYTESLHHDSENSISILAEVIESISGLPGRKAVLYVSDGLSIRPGEDLFQALEEQFDDNISMMRAQDYDLSRSFLRLSRAAASARVSLDSVDAAGLRPPSNADVAAYRAGRSSFADSIYVANLQEPLKMMADETGGKAVTNTNFLAEGLAAMVRSLSHYYELAYATGNSGSGRYRDIKVTVRNRKDLRLRHRRGYRDLALEQKIEGAIRAALSFGYTDNQMQLGLSTSSFTPVGDLVQVPVTIELPLSQLTLLPQENSVSAKVTVFVGVRDSEGRFSPIEKFHFPIAVATKNSAEVTDQVFKLQHTLAVRPGHQVVAVAVRDDFSSQYSVVLGGIDA